MLYFGFGWAKPVQVNPTIFKQIERKGMLYVALAGPLMNLVLAYLSAVALRIFPPINILGLFFFYLLWYNAMLAVLI